MNKLSKLQENACEIEATTPYLPKVLKFKRLIELSGCSELEAQEAFRQIWDKIY